MKELVSEEEKDLMACNYAFYMMILSCFRSEKEKKTPVTVMRELEKNYQFIGEGRQLEAEDLVLSYIENCLMALPAFRHAERYDATDRISRIPRTKNGGKRQYLHTLVFLEYKYVFELKPERDAAGNLHLKIKCQDSSGQTPPLWQDSL